MPLNLADKNVAILADDGFNEHQMTDIQRALTKVRARIKIVAPESAVVNGWQGEGWGHHFHVDAPIFEALGSDFDMLVLPGGTRSYDKLKANPHTKRIVNHFLEAGKPIAAISEGVGLLALSAKIAGHTVAAPAELADMLKAADVTVSEDAQEIDQNILSSNGEDLTAWVAEAVEFFSDAELVKDAA